MANDNLPPLDLQLPNTPPISVFPEIDEQKEIQRIYNAIRKLNARIAVLSSGGVPIDPTKVVTSWRVGPDGEKQYGDVTYTPDSSPGNSGLKITANLIAGVAFPAETVCFIADDGRAYPAKNTMLETVTKTLVYFEEAVSAGATAVGILFGLCKFNSFAFPSDRKLFTDATGRPTTAIQSPLSNTVLIGLVESATTFLFNPIQRLPAQVMAYPLTLLANGEKIADGSLLATGAYFLEQDNTL